MHAHLADAAFHDDWNCSDVISTIRSTLLANMQVWMPQYPEDTNQICLICFCITCLPCLLSLHLLTFSFFSSSKQSKYTSRVSLQGAKLIICQWFAPFLFKSPKLMTMSPLKSQNLLPWIYKTGPLIWVTISFLSLSASQFKPTATSQEG